MMRNVIVHKAEHPLLCVTELPDHVHWCIGLYEDGSIVLINPIESSELQFSSVHLQNAASSSDVLLAVCSEQVDDSSVFHLLVCQSNCLCLNLISFGFDRCLYNTLYHPYHHHVPIVYAEKHYDPTSLEIPLAFFGISSKLPQAGFLIPPMPMGGIDGILPEDWDGQEVTTVSHFGCIVDDMKTMALNEIVLLLYMERGVYTRTKSNALLLLRRFELSLDNGLIITHERPWLRIRDFPYLKSFMFPSGCFSANVDKLVLTWGFHLLVVDYDDLTIGLITNAPTTIESQRTAPVDISCDLFNISEATLLTVSSGRSSTIIALSSDGWIQCWKLLKTSSFDYSRTELILQESVNLRSDSTGIISAAKRNESIAVLTKSSDLRQWKRQNNTVDSTKMNLRNISNWRIASTQWDTAFLLWSREGIIIPRSLPKLIDLSNLLNESCPILQPVTIMPKTHEA